LVCISRVYVGGHYPLDIIGGVLLGAGISFLFLWKEKKLENIFSTLSNRINFRHK
jgi:membrane-associated phospholipid phosphatase